MPQFTSTTGIPARWRSPRARLWRTALIIGAGALTLTIATSWPLVQQHPFILLYAYVVSAVWWSDLRTGLLAVGLSVTGSALLSDHFHASPLDEVLFALASAVLLALVHRLRREHRAAEEARAAAENAVRARDDILATVTQPSPRHGVHIPGISVTDAPRVEERRLDVIERCGPQRVGQDRL